MLHPTNTSQLGFPSEGSQIDNNIQASRDPEIIWGLKKRKERKCALLGKGAHTLCIKHQSYLDVFYEFGGKFIE